MFDKFLMVLFFLTLVYFSYCVTSLFLAFREVFPLEWLAKQFMDFNVLMFLAIIIFTTALSKANTQKMLKEQSQELYNDFEELKDEIRGNTRK